MQEVRETANGWIFICSDNGHGIPREIISTEYESKVKAEIYLKKHNKIKHSK